MILMKTKNGIHTHIFMHIFMHIYRYILILHEYIVGNTRYFYKVKKATKLKIHKRTNIKSYVHRMAMFKIVLIFQIKLPNLSITNVP